MKNLFIRNLLFIGLSHTAIYATSTINCDTLKGCDKKACYIQENLDRAKEMKNSSKVEGLTLALEKVTKYCTNNSLKEDLQEEIKDTKEDLAEHTHDYEEAVKDKESDKIKKYQSKIDEDNEELAELKKELEELK